MLHEWREWGRLTFGWGIALAVMAVTTLVAGTGIPAPATWTTDPMWSWGARLLPVVLIWLAVGPVWTTLAPPREPARG